ncbi:MAG: hypothetical protein DRQ10_08490, partial [Candidatus Hydrothermota bacterium]
MEQTLKKALEGADIEYVDIRFEEVHTTQVVYLGKELDEVSMKVRRGGGVRAFHKGGFGFATFTFPEEAAEAVAKAVKLAKLASTGADEHFAPAKPVVAKVLLDVPKDSRKVPLEEKVALAKHYNDILLSGGDKIQSTRTMYRDEFIRHYFVSSEGSYIEEERLHTGISLSATAKDGTNVQTAYDSFGDQRGYDTVLGHEAEAEQVV